MREKQKLLVTSVFYPFGELSAISTKFKIVVCKLFWIGRVQNLSLWKGLTSELQKTFVSISDNYVPVLEIYLSYALGKDGFTDDKHKLIYIPVIVFNPLPNMPLFLRVWITSLLI